MMETWHRLPDDDCFGLASAPTEALRGPGDPEALEDGRSEKV